MVTGWLLKVVLGIALVGVALIELGSPLIARAQADDAAHEVATEASFATESQQAFDARCEETAAKVDVSIVRCEVSGGQVHVTVRKEAFSLFLDKWSVTDSWYNVTASATTQPR